MAKIGAFEDLPPGEWEVIGFGRAWPPDGSKSQEVRVDVFLARVGPDDRVPPGAIVQHRPVGCGHLMVTPIGSRWIGSTPSARPVSEPRIAEVSFLDDIVTVKRFTGTGAVPLYPAPYHSRYHRVQISDETAEGIVPLVELIRAAFGVSPGFMRQVFDGLRHPPGAKDRPCFDQGRSGLRNDGWFRIWCETACNEREALLGARVHSDDKLRMAHHGINAYLAPQRAKSAEGPWTIAVKALYGGARRWAFEWRPVVVEGEKSSRILITRIRGMEWKDRFQKLEIVRPGVLETSGGPPSQGRTTVGHSREVVIETGVAPGFGRPAVAILDAGVDELQTSPLKIDVKELINGEIVRAPAGRRTIDTRTSVAGSTSDRVSGGDDVVPVIQKKFPAAVGAPNSTRMTELAETEAAVRQAAIENGWTVGYSGKGSPPVFPIEVSAGAIDVLFMQVCTNFGCAMVVDIGTLNGRSYALGLVLRTDRRSMNDADVTAISKFIDRERGAWRGRTNALPGYETKMVVRRTAVHDDAERYSGLLGKRIAELF